MSFSPGDPIEPGCSWQAIGRRGEICVGYLERFAARRRPAVEALPKFADRIVALPQHSPAYLGDGRPLFRKPREVEPSSRQRRVQPRADVESLNGHDPTPP
jgi:hypothetical protein